MIHLLFQSKQTPLHLAAISGNLDICENLFSIDTITAKDIVSLFSVLSLLVCFSLLKYITTMMLVWLFFYIQFNRYLINIFSICLWYNSKFNCTNVWLLNSDVFLFLLSFSLIEIKKNYWFLPIARRTCDRYFYVVRYYNSICTCHGCGGVAGEA